MRWAGQDDAWLARPGDVMTALSHEGFEEYKHEVAHGRRDRRPWGGVWQGLNSRTGAVASAIWVSRPGADQALIFIEIDGEPVRGA
jgi:hypothetical protein